jgi:transposase
MELITILNRCHHFRGFVYQHAHFSADKKSIEVAVRPRKGSAAVCSRCHLPAPGYDQLDERRFEFIPLWGFLVFLLYTMRRVNCRRCGIVAVEEVPWGDGKRTLTKALKGECQDSIRSEAVGFSHGDFGFIFGSSEKFVGRFRLGQLAK